MKTPKVINEIIKNIKNILKLTGETSSNKNELKLNGAICYGDINNITIGERVSFGGNVILYSNSPITIGHDTMIAINVVIHTSTHDYSNHPMWIKRIDRPVVIGNHVWIGIGAIILPGVKIEDYAVVGAGSVVTSNVPKCAIVAGNPARIIKYRDASVYNSCDIIPAYPGEVVKEGLFAEDKQCKNKGSD